MTEHTIALVVDDDPTVAGVAARVLGMLFDQVIVASTPAEAEILLGSHRVTHLLCDYDLGQSQPTGAELIPQWRAAYPYIAQAVLFSGSQAEEIDLPAEVDRLLGKPATMDELLGAFEVRV